MPEAPSNRPGELKAPVSWSRECNEAKGVEDSDDTMAAVAQLIEKLLGNTSPQEKELVTTRLLGLANSRKEARALIGSHSRAIPLFISILRGGTPIARVNAAAILSILSKKEDLRLKVLLGGCIPPLLSLLKSDSNDVRKAAAEAIYEVSCGGLGDDHVGVKIFVTEGVVPALWEQLSLKDKQDILVEGYVAGALKNLCGDKDGYWRKTIATGGVDIIVELLSSSNASSRSNAASLLARTIPAFKDDIVKVLDSGAVKILLGLLDRENEISVRASAADALEALSSHSSEAKKSIVDAGGIPILVGAVVAPSKECMQGEHGQALQGHATGALASICGGMHSLIFYLGELARSPRAATPISDIVGALAYTLMVFEQKPGLKEAPFEVKQIEDILVMLLKLQHNSLVQDRILEALASLYGNSHLSIWLNCAEAKKIIVGLLTMASAEVQEHLVVSLTSLCSEGGSLWVALKRREGIQLLISFLGLSSEQHQELASSFWHFCWMRSKKASGQLLLRAGFFPIHHTRLHILLMQQPSSHHLSRISKATVEEEYNTTTTPIPSILSFFTLFLTWILQDHMNFTFYQSQVNQISALIPFLFTRKLRDFCLPIFCLLDAGMTLVAPEGEARKGRCWLRSATAAARLRAPVVAATLHRVDRAFAAIDRRRRRDGWRVKLGSSGLRV